MAGQSRTEHKKQPLAAAQTGGVSLHDVLSAHEGGAAAAGLDDDAADAGKGWQTHATMQPSVEQSGERT